MAHYMLVSQEYGKSSGFGYVSGNRTEQRMSRAAAEAVFETLLRVDQGRIFYACVHKIGRDEAGKATCDTIRWAEGNPDENGEWHLIEKEA